MAQVELKKVKVLTQKFAAHIVVLSLVLNVTGCGLNSVGTNGIYLKNASSSSSLSLYPSAVGNMPVGSSYTFTASGGSGTRTFSMLSGPGSIGASSGAYTAPSDLTAGSSAVVQVTDATGVSVSSTISLVNSGSSSTLAVSASRSTVTAGQTSQLSVSGGVSPYTYTILSGQGSMDTSTTGQYNAPSSISYAQTTTVQVRDSNGLTANVTINLSTSAGTSSALFAEFQDLDRGQVISGTQSITVVVRNTWGSNVNVSGVSLVRVTSTGSLVQVGTRTLNADGTATISLVTTSWPNGAVTLQVNAVDRDGNWYQNIGSVQVDVENMSAAARTFCTNNGGSIFADTLTGIPMCKLSRNSCPAGWKPYSNWTATNNVSCDGGTSISCGQTWGRDVQNTGSHEWANIAPETVTVRQLMACGSAGGSAYTSNRTTCTAAINQIGCVLSN